MASLSDWYRYVDRVSRPSNRDEEPAVEVQAWRPWRETDEGVSPETPAAIGSVPDLADLLGEAVSQPEAASAGREEFEDLTVHDELPPSPTFAVPDLQAPSFELRTPKWGALHEEEAAPEAPLPDGRSRAVPSGVRSAVARIKASPNWELLGRVREEEHSPDGRGRLRESRQELIERLVDPTLSLEQTAVILGVCPTTVRRYTNKGLLRHFRTKGNQRRFRLSDVAEFMESRAAEIEADSRAEQVGFEEASLS